MHEGKYFYSPSEGRLGFDQVIVSLFDFICEEPSRHYRVIIGTDSKEGRSRIPLQVFVTALIIHRVGFGGRYYWRKTFRKDLYGIRDKIYHEAFLSLQTSQKLLEELKRYPGNHLSNYHLEIHVDIGVNGPTRAMIREVIGMIESMGFIARIKPDSFGASQVAHRHT
ncbi:MAG TPA: ribonuclease H-like YkuK family protein [Atribacteraceae bacterium]|nr:ribonuclease H-like YkuK family protein [Atribacteraceae bacterium]